MLRLSPLVLVSLAVMVIVWRTDSMAISGLFQSSPVETPQVLTPTATTEVQVTATSTLQATVAAETSTAAPTESVVPVETATEAPPTALPSPTVTEVPTELPPTDTPAASATAETAEPESTVDENQRYPEGDSEFRFEWGMLFDSLALFFSYAWLFCGIILFLAVPLLFFLLWRASARRREEAQEQGQDQEG